MTTAQPKPQQKKIAAAQQAPISRKNKTANISIKKNQQRQNLQQARIILQTLKTTKNKKIQFHQNATLSKASAERYHHDHKDDEDHDHQEDHDHEDNEHEQKDQEEDEDEQHEYQKDQDDNQDEKYEEE